MTEYKVTVTIEGNDLKLTRSLMLYKYDWGRPMAEKQKIGRCSNQIKRLLEVV